MRRLGTAVGLTGVLVSSLLVLAGPASTAASSGSATVRVLLAPRGGLRALERAVTAVSTPGSSRYRRFLTPTRFRARYEPTVSQLHRTEQALRAGGLTIISVERFRRWIVARGSTGSVSAAGSAPHVIGVIAGAATGAAPRSHKPLPPVDAATTAALFQKTRPCSNYYGARSARFQADGKTPLPAFRGEHPPYMACGYGPRQLRQAYEGRTSLTGKGVTVAIVLPFANATLRRDANRYASSHGDPPLTSRQFSQRLPRTFDLTNAAGCGAPDTFELEQPLDVEAVHTMAPGAAIRYYAAARCDDPTNPGTIAALDEVLDENRASIVTDSYGDPEAAFSPGVRTGYEQAFLQAAMQGITVLYSSGDFGSVFDYPASDPWVTAVGGTTAAIDRRNRLAFQAAWESDSYLPSADASSWKLAGALSGSGGGFSRVFARPAWQRGLVPASSPPGRAVPDLALDGSPMTSMAVGTTQRFPSGVRYGEVREGGTSLASPLMAGIEALSVQSAGGRLGWINPAIYREAKHHARTLADVGAGHASDAAVQVRYVEPLNPAHGRIYELRTLGSSVGFGMRLVPRAGWDPASGLGTPTRRYLVSQGR